MRKLGVAVALAAGVAAGACSPTSPGLEVNPHDEWCYTQGIEPAKDKPGMVYWDEYAGAAGTGWVYPGCAGAWDKLAGGGR